MEIVDKAFEITATIDANRQLVLDEPLPVTGPAKVRVIILLHEEVDTDEKEWLRSASTNPAPTLHGYTRVCKWFRVCVCMLHEHIRVHPQLHIRRVD